MASMDRLSALPDHILCHILSFLPTKISVSTSTLSTRWRTIWAHVPTICFNSGDYLTYTITYATFPMIINRVMMLHKVRSLDSITLFVPFFRGPEYDLESFIMCAKSRNVRNLDIHFDPERMLPRCFSLFSCASLTRLKLSGFICSRKTGNAYFPSLKKLHLEYFRCQSDKDLSRLLSGCSVLEDLVLDDIYFDDKISLCFDVSLSTLKRLTFIYEYDFYDSDLGLEYSLKINAPALIYLKVRCVNSSFSVDSVSPLTSLIEADIRMSYISMLKFLHCLCNVRCLTLRGEYTKEFGDMAFACPILKFDNLTKLVYEHVACWPLLRKFLEIADNLEILIVDIPLDPERMLSRCFSLFSCASLTRLKLSGFICSRKTGNAYFPSLKKLHLEYFRCQSDKDLSRLLSGCPVLEDFVLDDIYFDDKISLCFDVSLSTLKRLTFIYEYDFYDSGLEYSLKINAPALIYLKVRCVNSSFSVDSVSPLTSLIEADIRMSYISMLKFIHCLCNVRCLTLRGEYTKEFGDMAFACPILKFDNLTKLVYEPVACWPLLKKFLEIADNLEILIVDSDCIEDIYTHRYWEELEQVPACLLSHLRTNSISGIEPT
ncbi:hypothetical protein CASFOL_030150 [Castilleja foliolosa]|uniref:F-box domain-containing protein n=1 Tax=Castilleja foliolosa TaxID=1961234 RepID=A0ABD3C9Y1_9LAMI